MSVYPGTGSGVRASKSAPPIPKAAAAPRPARPVTGVDARASAAADAPIVAARFCVPVESSK